MKRRKALSLLLSLTLLLSLALPATTAYAEEGSSNKGMEISKTATANKDGSYTITLEAYATGTKVISEVTKDVPTDIILVLDQSGSMANDIGTVSFEQYEDETDWRGRVSTYHTRNQDYYEYRHNGGSSNLWHKLADDSYVSVSVARQEKVNYTTITNGKNNSTQNGATNYYNNRNNLYALVNGEYQKVDVGYSVNVNRTYTYKLPDGTQIASSRGNATSPTFSNIDGNVLYLAVADDTATTYTYTYTDSNNNVQTIGTSTGATTVFSPALYERVTSTSGGGTRLDALKNAVNNFANAVHTKSLGKDGQAGGGDDIDHRIALVGFSSPDYNNTELLTGSDINQGDWKGTNISTSDRNGYYYFPTGYEMNGPQYGSISDAQYKAALLPMNTDAGLSGVASGVNALTARGGTRTDNGLAMANKIFEQNPIPNGEKRNRVVIVFTDGIPGLTGYDSDVASSAITQASTAKNTYGATVYTIGVFSGADANSAGSLNTKSDADKGNYFLQRVSSNTQYPQRPSYYLSASDSASLNNIFQQISEQIDEGGSSSTLTGDAVVRDIVSPYFTLPSGATAANITLESYSYKGNSLTAADAWEKNETALGAEASIDTVKDETTGVEQNRVNVRGFNFSENWCGTESQTGTVGDVTYRGNKLVISFKVTPRVGFLGGNNVPTNGEDSGVYENVDAKTAVEEFTVPKANVTIKDVTTTAEDKNVYLLRSVTKEELQSGATVTVGADEEGKGGIKLDLSKAGDTEQPYGLEKWQSEYVNIKVTIKDKDGTEITETDLQNLKEDSEYSIEVKIAPKEEAEATSAGPEATAKTDKGKANINVFKPQLTFKDGNAYYGETAWDDTQYGTNCKTTEKWLHAAADETSTEDIAVTMLGTRPELTITYTPDATKLYEDAGTQKFGKADVPVKAETKIDAEDVTKYTTFVHTPCPEDSGYSWTKPTTPGDPAFLIHIKTCKLTVTKAGDSTLDNGSYVFTVRKAGQPYSEVSIQGNGSQTLCELPVGTYSIEEDTGWSWRYSEKPSYSENVDLSSAYPEGTITCTNTRVKDKWLDGYSAIVRNVFGIGSSSAADSDTQ